MIATAEGMGKAKPRNQTKTDSNVVKDDFSIQEKIIWLFCLRSDSIEIIFWMAHEERDICSNEDSHSHHSSSCRMSVEKQKANLKRDFLIKTSSLSLIEFYVQSRMPKSICNKSRSARCPVISIYDRFYGCFCLIDFPTKRTFVPWQNRKKNFAKKL